MTYDLFTSPPVPAGLYVDLGGSEAKRARWDEAAGRGNAVARRAAKRSALLPCSIMSFISCVLARTCREEVKEWSRVKCFDSWRHNSPPGDAMLTAPKCGHKMKDMCIANLQNKIGLIR